MIKKIGTSALINTTNIVSVNVLGKHSKGIFRYIVKTGLGMTCLDARDFNNITFMETPEAIISGYKKGALQTVQFKPEGSETWATIFSRTGKKVKLVDESILRSLTVGTINSLYNNTNLMDMTQYKTVNSKCWASTAFVMNDN